MSAWAAKWLQALLAWMVCCVAAAAQQPAAAISSVAFYYGANPPLADLQAFDVAVVEPDFVPHPQTRTRAAKDGAHELFAYVSLGEVQPSRPWYNSLPPGSLRDRNAVWGSRVIDQTAPGWSEFFLSRIIDPLWRQGWRGFFLDTLDSYRLFAKTDAERAAQTAAMIDLLREFKRRYPDAKLILNRGFELLPAVAPLTYAVAAESLYRGYDAGRGAYRAVPDNDRAWLLGQLETVRERYHLPVIAIDYVDPAQPEARELARRTAEKIRSHGFIPWVADGALASIGVGGVELVPRTVLVLLDVAQNEDLHTTEAQRFLGIHLNHLGLRYEFVDLVRQPLPDMIMAGRYAGVVTWFREGVGFPALVPWLKKRIDEGVPVAIFGAPGFQMTAPAAAMLGLAAFNAPVPERLTIESSDPEMIGFETPPRPDRGAIEALRLTAAHARSLLRMKDNRGNLYDAAALTPWGGFVFRPFVTVNLPMLDQPRWVVQPLTFLKAALKLPDLPMPDVTTEGGRRILMSHMDGDGFPSRAEYPGSPFAVEVLQREIWDRYRLPITISVVEGELSPKGVYPALSHLTEALARRMFALPYVEAASHSFSHPFSWADAMNDTRTTDITQAEGEAAHTLNVPNYRFDLQREIKGSMDYINATLMPAGKKAEIFFWTGNCVPLPSAIAQVYLDGYLNMNGGDTMITETRNTWTAIAAQGVRKDGWYQVYAPDQDENVYTGNWNGPFYGFERVIETFKLTEQPERFKPVDIYYHFYAGTKPASIAALHKIHRWALAQPFTHLYASQYIRKVIDFENTSVARAPESGDLIVRSGPNLRTLRLAPGAPAPSLTGSSGVAGIAPGPAGRYLITAASEVRLSYRAGAGRAAVPGAVPAAVLSLYEASGAIDDFTRSDSPGKTELRFTLNANGPATFSVGGGRQCSATADGKPLRRAASNKNSISALPYPDNAAIGKSGGAAVTQYEIGTSSTNFATTRHLVFVQCAV